MDTVHLHYWKVWYSVGDGGGVGGRGVGGGVVRGWWWAGGAGGRMAADTLESLETLSGFQKVEPLSQGVKGTFVVQRDSHNHRPQCGKKATLRHTGLLEGISEGKLLQESNENMLPAVISAGSPRLRKATKTTPPPLSLSLHLRFFQTLFFVCPLTQQ